MKEFKRRNNETKLTTTVREIANSSSESYDSIESWSNDLLQQGCQSGMISELIYYTDTVKFFNQFKTEINELLSHTIEDTGLSVIQLFGKKWDETDPLANEQFNQNLLSWFAFEETVRTLIEKQQ